MQDILIAQGIDVNSTGLPTTAGKAGFTTSTAPSLTGSIGTLLQTALGFTGFIIFALMLYAGILWMTAAGNEEQVGKAKTILRNAVIGFVIITAAYAITFFVTTSLTT